MLNEFLKKEAPIQGLAGMGGGVPSRLLTLASGTTTYVEDVFSTFLYEGNSTARSINNGIDLAGEGGMVWVKTRNTDVRHGLFDTERGTGKALLPNENWAQVTDNTELTSFNSNGFNLGDNSGGYQFSNINGNTQVSWTFRKCPGFFDVVTYTGNGTAGRTVSHSLGSVPGAIWVKCTSHADSWGCYHRSTGNTQAFFLNSDGTGSTNGVPWNTTDPTSTEFTLGADNQYNGNGRTYVAYLFAHNDGSFGEDSDEAVIKCGTYTGTGQSGFPGNKITLGFEPQWLLIKAIDQSGTDWEILDSTRGMFADTNNGSPYLRANVSNAEFSNDHRAINLHADGFSVQGNNTSINGTSGDDFIYIAIRRPHKPPEAGTDVFAIDPYSGSTTLPFVAPFAPDLAFIKHQTSSSSWFWVDRLRGNNALSSNNKNGDSSASAYKVQFRGAFSSSWTNYIGYMFKRAPGFFDVVAYTGNGVQGRNISHNLKVAPELMIVKNRDTSNDDWMVYVSGVTYQSVHGNDPDSYGNNPPTLKLQSTDAANFSMSGTWDHTHPTASVFRVGDTGSTNGSNENLIAYLFSSLDGISKVGSYSGSSSSVDVDCGFTNGARFVFIKRIDSTANWVVFDTERGINSGTDPYLAFNNTDAQNSSYDAIDTLASGFTVNSGNGNYNTNGGTYLFLAIA